MPKPQTAKIGFILKGYPRLSETFIAQEIHALEQRGLDIVIYSLRHPTDRDQHPIHAEITAPVHYLPEYLYQEPIRVWRAWRAVRKQPHYRTARRVWLRDLRRDRTSNRVRRFGQALVLAHERAGSIGQFHAHFIHTPGSVARYTALLTGLPWTVSAHAKDIWTIPAWEKAEKLAHCDWAVTCTKLGVDHLSGLAPEGRVSLLYHGLDLDRFPPPPALPATRSGPFRILSVGRAVPKKGYAVLLQALATLGDAVDWQFTHLGGGSDLDHLKRRAETLDIADRCTWLGARPQRDVLAAIRDHDVFVLPSRIADDGDRDGMPNVLLEAQSQGLACLSTRVSAIPELIVEGETGLLVAPEDAPALAAGLRRLHDDPGLRQHLGDGGQKRVRTHFPLDACIAPLAERFGLDPPPVRRAAEA